MRRPLRILSYPGTHVFLGCYDAASQFAWLTKGAKEERPQADWPLLVVGTRGSPSPDPAEEARKDRALAIQPCARVEVDCSDPTSAMLREVASAIEAVARRQKLLRRETKAGELPRAHVLLPCGRMTARVESVEVGCRKGRNARVEIAVRGTLAGLGGDPLSPSGCGTVVN
jgi:hypothetical protein